MPAWAQWPKLEVAVQRVEVEQQYVFDVSASGAVRAMPAAVWKILTDYERMPEFVPDMKTSRVLSRSASEVIVDQYGVARFLFFSRDIHLVVRVVETPFSAIDIGLISGDMKIYACRWEFTALPDGAGTRIAYTGKLAPKFYVPGMLGANIIRSDIERMMTAVLARLERAD